VDLVALEKIVSDQLVDFINQQAGITRTIEVHSHLKIKDITVITGVRRCGKSTLLASVAREVPQTSTVFYINFDDPRLVDFKASDFEPLYKLWVKNAPAKLTTVTIFIDEVQNIPGWEQWITFFSRKTAHKVFITGSNSKLLSSELATFLTGRHLDLHLTPLSFHEIVQHYLTSSLSRSTSNEIETEKLFESYWLYGGFPRSLIDRNLSYLPVYYSDIVTKDIVARNKVRNKVALSSLSRLLASETSRPFSHSKTARILGLKDEASVRKYCRFFLECFLYYELRCFSRSVRNQVRSQPRYFCVDHALAKMNGLWKVDDPARVLELMVCTELHRRTTDIFYWRSTKNFEVDFVLARGIEPTSAIQVCYSLSEQSTYDREVRALLAAEKELGIKELIIITRYEQKEIPTKAGVIQVVPIIDWLLRGV
jgi:predicted AAA+ superfamily ATPase